jgi:hypothetical protein
MFSTDPCVACAVTLAPGIGVDTRKRRPQGVIDPVGAAGKDCDQLFGARIGGCQDQAQRDQYEAHVFTSTVDRRCLLVYFYSGVCVPSCRLPLKVGTPLSPYESQTEAR